MATKQLRIQQTALALALASAWPLQAMAAAGVAQFTTGDVSVRRGSEQLALSKGRTVESGDQIVTGAGGRAQLRFSDGGMVALQPNTQFNIARYSDANDPKQDSFLVDLVRGGMRAITGLIGKRNRDNYKVTTTTATVGIRGSSFNLTYLPDGRLSVSTEQDAIEVCTQAGCTGLTAGESAIVVSADQPAVRTNTRSSLPIPAPTREPTVKNDDSNPEGSSAIIGGGHDEHPQEPEPTDPSYSVVAGVAVTSVGKTSGGATDQRRYLNGAVVLETSTGKPQYFLAAGNEAEGTTSGDIAVVGAAGSVETGDLMILATSAGNWKAGSSSVDLSNVAFAVGVPAPTSAITSLNGMRGEYALSVATPVFSTQGSTGELLSGSKLSVDFIGAGNFVDVDLLVRMPALTGNALPAVDAPNSTDFSLRGGVGSAGVGFGGKVTVSSEACAAGVDSCGVGSVSGFFGGPEASTAALSYLAQGNAYGSFGGAALFARSGTSETPVEQVFTNATSGDTSGNMTFAAVGQVPGGSWFSLNYSNLSEFMFTGSELVKVTAEGSSVSNIAMRTSSGQAFHGAMGAPGDSDFIGWGRWVAGNLSQTGMRSGSADVEHVHTLVGVPTVAYQMPISGTAAYDLVGGTAPTAKLNGFTQVGELVSGSLAADFTAGTVGVNIGTRFGSNNVNIANSSVGITGSTFASGGDAATFIKGFFSGNLAARAGLVYSANDAAVGRITGAAGFQRVSGSGLAVSPP